MKIHPLPLSFLLALAFAPSAFPQGADDCAQAQPISGLGSFSVSLQNKTPSGSTPLNCTGLGIDEDAWFDWTATSSGLFGVEICGSSAAGWALAVWTDCGGTAITCREFNCQYEDSRILFHAIAGSTYKIQVSSPVFWAGGQMNVVSVDLPPNDDCANATPLSVYGDIPFDLTDATQDGPDISWCLISVYDVWFVWTSPYDRPVQFRCETPGINVAVFDGCGGGELQCSRATLLGPAITYLYPQAGETFLIRVSNGRAPGILEIRPDEVIVDTTSDSAYALLYRQSTFQEARLFAQSYRYRGIPGDLAAITSQAEDDFINNQIELPNQTGFGLYQDMNDPNFSEPAGGWKWVTGEAFSYTNWLPPNRPDNSMNVEHFGTLVAGKWEDSPDGSYSYLAEWDLDSKGTAFCDPAEPNSIGLTTQLFAEGSSSAPASVRLEAADGPAGQFGYFLIGTAAIDPGVAAGNGTLCLSTTGGNLVGRYNAFGTQRNSVGRFDDFGALENLVGTSSTGTGYDLSLELPIAGGGLISAGQTWHFQLTHREPGGQFNFSNGISLTF